MADQQAQYVIEMERRYHPCLARLFPIPTRGGFYLGRMRVAGDSRDRDANDYLNTAAEEPESCRPRPEVLSHLARTYRELSKGVGLIDAGNLVEALSANDGYIRSVLQLSTFR